MDDTANYLADLLGRVIVQTGPVLISKAEWEEGLPEDALGVMVEETQEGYLIFITDKDHTDDTNTDTDGS